MRFVVLVTLLTLFNLKVLIAQSQGKKDTIQLPTLTELRFSKIEDFRTSKLPIKRNNSIIYVKNNPLSFFCKLEDNYRKDNNIFFKFRLGSQDYVDYLEQKPHAEKLNTR